MGERVRKRGYSIALTALTALLVVVLTLLGKCAYDRRMRKIDFEAMRLGAEDVSRRIVETRENLAHITALYNETAISAARTFARMIADDPSILEDRERFVSLKVPLGVDELHVSDSNGVLIVSEPISSTGYRMYSRDQSAAFMPAITNRAFELVQEPMIKGIEYKLFQYAGVARLDSPGIVQIGLKPERLESATSVADIAKIAATTRVGRGGQVSIIKLDDRERVGKNRVHFEVFASEGGRTACLQTDCDDYRIIITMPCRGWTLADDVPFRCLADFAMAVFVLILLLALQVMLRGGLRPLLADFGLLFSSVREGNGTNRLGAVFILALAVFVLGLGIAWWSSTASEQDRARKLILRGSEEFCSDFSYAPDDCLFFVGRAIMQRYPTVDSFGGVDLGQLLVEYGIDELNVVDRDGLLVATTMAGDGLIGQRQRDFKGPREFCEHLIDSDDEAFSQPFRESASEKGVFRMYAGVAFPRSQGYIQIGFDEKRIARGFDYGLVELADGWSIGERGYFTLARNTGDIVSCGNRGWREARARGELLTLAGVGLDITLLPESDEEDAFFEAVLFGERCLCHTRRLGNYHRMIAAMPVAEIAESRNLTVTIAGFILFIVLGFSCFFGTRLFNLVSQLRRYIAEDAKRRERDMVVAKTVQTSSLPLAFPDTENLRIAAKMITAKEVGGDFYDFYQTPSGKLFFLVADTSGKGIPAAMFMMKSKAIIRACVLEYEDFAAAVAEMNNRLAENNDANMFVTAWLGLLDAATGTVEFVNCGHNPPLIHRANGTVEWLRARSGMTLAAMEGMKYRVGSFRLGKGDTLLLYTDGVTEAMNVGGELYGEPRLEKLVAASESSRLVQSVESDVFGFAAGAEQADDITMMTLEIK